MGQSSPLAKYLTDAVSELGYLRVISTPGSFEDIRGEGNVPKLVVNASISVWRKWAHDVVEQLEEWRETLDKYFGLFGGRWRDYASVNRLQQLWEYGGSAEQWRKDGSLKLEVGDGELSEYSIFVDLLGDDSRLASQALPADIAELSQLLEHNARNVCPGTHADYSPLPRVAALMLGMRMELENAVEAGRTCSNRTTLLRRFRKNVELLLSMKLDEINVESLYYKV